MKARLFYQIIIILSEVETQGFNKREEGMGITINESVIRVGLQNKSIKQRKKRRRGKGKKVDKSASTLAY